MGNNSGKPGERSIRVNEADLPHLQRVFEQIGGGKKIKEHELTVSCKDLRDLYKTIMYIPELLEQSYFSIPPERYLPLLVCPRQPSSANHRLQDVH